MTFSYTHHDSVDEMYSVLSESVENDILEGLKASPFVALQIDEGTDCSNLSTLMIYVRYLADGKVKSKFISVNELPGASSDDIFGILIQFLKEKNIDVSKIIGIASDGASVMQGVKKGVTTKLKSYCPFLVRTHCMAHRLALASEKACKQVPYMIKFLEVVNRLGKLCKFSPKFCRELESSKTLLGNTGAGKLKQIFFTRWLSFNDCIEAMVNCIDSLIACLHTVREDSAHGVTATGILKNVASYKFIATTYFCADVVGILSILSKCMQKQGLLYSNIKSQVESSMVAILAFQETDGPYLKEFKNLIDATPPTEFPMVSTFKSHDISDSEKQRNEFVSIRKNLIQNIVQFMENWFPDSGIMNAFCCLDPKSLTTLSHDQFEELLEHFGNAKKEDDHQNAERKQLEPMVNKTAARTEFSIVEGIIKQHQHLDIETFYCQFIYTNTDAYPNLKILYEAALVCPCTSVDCERGFSQYNLIKTNHRNLLKITHVNQLAMIAIEGPALSVFDFKSAFEVWINKKDRRVFKAMFDLESKTVMDVNQNDHLAADVNQNVQIKNKGVDVNQNEVEVENCENDVLIENKIKRLEELMLKVIQKKF